MVNEELDYLEWKAENVGLTADERIEFHKLLLMENEGCDIEC